ncbi:hypothetical protein SLS64_006858 [Diaporthe eres]|uniref:Uncharacterized protein n=1 Tax=Diaporthe eres TaxID=83184 RepID=A0ABR1PB83_DIAER
MGGLVIKKMYLLSRQDDSISSLAKRLHSIYFLATPHRGSDSAKLLKNILQMASSNRAYIDDLDRNSGAIQSINDAFRNFSGEVKLWSFYETQKLNIGMINRLIVDPDSAILGYKEEMQIPMNADHRSICKFESPTDPNYVVIRNSLASTVNDILKEQAALKPDSLEKIIELKKYLGVSSTYEDDLMTVQDARVSAMQTQDEHLKDANDASLWRKLFVNCILQVQFTSQFWVIDAVDDLVEEKSRCFNVDSDDHRKALVQKVIDKAQGSFLWTILVLEEISNAYSKEEIESILQELPPKMEDLYYRTLQSMSRLHRGKQLAKAILTWTRRNEASPDSATTL